jgi:hypothetical protein
VSDWTDVAKTFDIATGFFEIGALLELDGRTHRAIARDVQSTMIRAP